MKKYLRKILEFIKKYKLIFIIGAIVLILVGVIYFIFFRTKIDTVKKVKTVLKNKYYSVECLDGDCDYIVASKGDKYGKYTTYVYDANGKKIAKINDTYDANASYTKKVYSATKNYIIFTKNDYISGKIKGYSLTNTNGKAKYNSDDTLYALTNHLISEDKKDHYRIIDSNGKEKFSKVTNIKTFANNSVLSFDNNSESMITDEKGNVKIKGYSIVYEVKDKNGKLLYFVAEDTNKNGYYYYSYKSNKIEGDSFNGYVDGPNAGELIITKKENGLLKKYLLTKDGKQEVYEKENLSDIVNSIKGQVDTKEYYIYSGSIKSASQKVVFVNKKSNNTFGVYNLSSKKYTKLLKYSKDNGGVTISELESDNGLYLQVNCNNYCKKNTTIVYDINKNKEIYKYESKENIPQEYIGYEKDYKVIKYSLNSSEDYKAKFVLYDKDNKELMKSSREIVIVDKKKIIGKNTPSSSLVLFDTKQNKALNNEDNLASKMSVGSTYVYKYSDKDKMYILNENGKVLSTLSTSASLIYSDSTIIYIEDNKINIINPIDNKAKSYKLNKNEKMNDNSGQNIAPYKNSIYINNTKDLYARVINANGRTVKNIKKSSINSVNYNEKNNTVIIITKRIDNSNSLYGLYIAK